MKTSTTGDPALDRARSWLITRNKRIIGTVTPHQLDVLIESSRDDRAPLVGAWLIANAQRVYGADSFAYVMEMVDDLVDDLSPGGRTFGQLCGVH